MTALGHPATMFEVWWGVDKFQDGHGMKRPSPFFVPHEDVTLWRRELERVAKLYPDAERPEELTDPAAYWRDRDFDRLEDAGAFAREIGGDVFERYGFEDVTPPGDPPGLLWEWHERRVK